MKRNWVTAAIFWGMGLCALLVTAMLVGSENLYGSVIRLHVLANSDSAEDQAIKLEVRDRVLTYCAENFAMEDRDRAEAELRAGLEGIQAAAEEKLRELGRDESVTVTLSRENYPTRHYEDVSLPGGTYTSLRVCIGEAAGKNWWCVLFPPICLDSATSSEAALLEAGMDEENVKTVTLQSEQYEVRFRVLEWWQKLKEKIPGNF